MGGPNGNNGYQFAITNNNTVIATLFNAPGEPWPTNAVAAVLPNPIPVGAWTHVATTYDGASLNVYVNGALVGTRVVGPKNVVDSASNFRISGDDNGNVHFRGLIEDVEVYGRARSAGELQELALRPGVPRISIFDASALEGSPGVGTSLDFLVKLSAPASDTVTVQYASAYAGDTATPAVDYAAATRTLTFAPGETARTIALLVNGDETPEADETVTLVLTNPVNATMTVERATGTIGNDDVAGLPQVPGFEVAVYATLSEPTALSFDPSGVLYVGNGDNADSGARIRRVGAGGRTLVEYGPLLWDPDGVLFDRDGAIFGVPGAVLVGRSVMRGTPNGEVTVVRPDQTSFTGVTIVASGMWANPDVMAFDPNGRLIVNDPGAVSRVLVVTGSPGSLPVATTLFTLPMLAPTLAVDGTGRIFSPLEDGTIVVHDSFGQLVDDRFVTGLGPWPVIAFANGGVFGSDLYAIGGDGHLYRVDDAGQATDLGSGFAPNGRTSGLTFGPDGALYVSDYEGGRIYRVRRLPG